MKTFALFFYLIGVLIALVCLLLNLNFSKEDKWYTKVLWILLCVLLSSGSWIIVTLFFIEWRKQRKNKNNKNPKN
jgi:heme A synthase